MVANIFHIISQNMQLARGFRRVRWCLSLFFYSILVSFGCIYKACMRCRSTDAFSFLPEYFRCKVFLWAFSYRSVSNHYYLWWPLKTGKTFRFFLFLLPFGMCMLKILCYIWFVGLIKITLKLENARRWKKRKEECKREDEREF